MTRVCATPGCRLRDHHDGPHSHESHGRRFRKTVWRHSRHCIAKPVVRTPAAAASAKRTTSSTFATRAPNDFQLGIDVVRAAVDGQRGVRLRMPKTAFCGHWPDALDVCTGKLVGPSYEGKFVAEALFDGDAEPTLLTASSLMLHETHVSWRKSHIDASALLRDKCKANVKHVNALGRAEEMYETLLASKVNLRGRIVLTLDGMGTNRVAGERVLESVSPSERPETLTLEMDANVALAQRIGLGFGDRVRFTGADPTLACRSLLLKRTGCPTLEDVVVTPHNRVLTEEEKRRVVWLNLDYCGGPPKNHSANCAPFMEACLAHLPHLHMVTVTIARHNHADLDTTFGDYFPTPYGFDVRRTYTDNVRVVCKMYVRNPRLTRHVSIPGRWWRDAAPEWRTSTFDGIVVGRAVTGQYDVYVPVDDAVYSMRDDAVAAYAAD